MSLLLLFPGTGAPAFDPATGFPWQPEDRQDRSLARTDYDPTEQAWAIGPPSNVVAQSVWTDVHEFGDQTRRDYDPSEQAWSVGPPQNAVLLSNWTVEYHFPDQSRRDYDPSEQSWAIGPPLNADRLTQWTSPQDEPAFAQGIDSTDQAWPVQSPTAAAFDPATGFPWTVESDLPDQSQRTAPEEQQAWSPQPVVGLSAFTDPQADPAPALTADPTDQAWSVGQPQNADRLTAFTDPHDLPDQTVRAYDGQDGAFGIPPIAPTVFDPATGFPWTVGDPQQDQSLQPVWTDGQHGALGLVPPTSETLLAGIWNLDVQQDRSTQPVWYDPSEQSYTIQPPLDPATLASLWNGSDPSQDRSLQPVWYQPEFGNVWSGALVFVISGGAPAGMASAAPIPSLSIANPTATPSASGPRPAGGASDPTPSGSASGPTPRGQAS